MKRTTKLLGLLALVTMSCLIAAANPTGPQTNSYSRDGLSFEYPADWPLSDQSDAQAQTLSLDRGQNEAKILILVLRQRMGPQQLAEAQARMTQAIVDSLTQSFTQEGLRPLPSSVSAMIGGRQATGIRLRAVLQNEAGNADVYWLALGDRLVHLILIGADPELARASNAWNMVCSTLRVEGGIPPPPAQAAAPVDLGNYAYRRITGRRIELYMDEWGRGYVRDLNNNAWVRIPDYSGRASHHPGAQEMPIQIHPSFCKTSDTMALMYAFGGLLVYDSGLYSPQNPGQAWRLNYEVSQRGQAFASISRSKVIYHISQVDDQLALAAGTNWICVYDLSLHRWVNYQGAVDDSTAELDQNIVLAAGAARVRILNGPVCSYGVGTGSWRCSAGV